MRGFGTRWNALIVLLFLAILTGCQAVNAKSANPQPESAGVVLNNGTLDFGNVLIGTSKTLDVTVVNNTGSSVDITAVSISGPDFVLSAPSLPLSIPTGQSGKLSFTFAPTGVGNFPALASISTNASPTPLLLTLNGNAVAPGQLGANPSNIDFGAVPVGSKQTKPAVLTNVGGTSVTISEIAVTGSGFQASGLNLPFTLDPGQSVSLSVSFTPQAGGKVSGAVSLAGDVSQTPNGLRRKAQLRAQRIAGRNADLMIIPLAGTGVNSGQLSATPASVAFGDVPVGTNQSRPVTLTNSGGTSVTVTQAAVTGPGFSVSGLSLPVTIPAGGSTAFSVKFAPQSPGSASGNVALISDATNSPLNVPLSGNGITAGALTANPASVNFGSVQVGTNQQQPVTVTNSGGTDVTITQAKTTGQGFSVTGPNLPLTLGAGASTTFTVKFAPQLPGNASGNLAIVNDGSNPTLNVPLSGTGVAPGSLVANPTNLNFGNVQVGKNQTNPDTITNTGGVSVTVTQATVTGAGFSISGLTLPLTLGPGQSKTFNVTFAPQSPGGVNGNIAIVNDGSNPTLNIPLSGTGVAAGFLTANPTNLNFGNVQVGNNQSKQDTLTNTGGVSVTVTQATVTGAGFSISGLTLPLTLGPGQSKTFNVTFAPQSPGGVNGNIAIVNDGSNPTLNVPLSGTGVAPGSLVANPSSLDFGNVQVGNNQSKQDTITNTGGVDVTITQTTVTGAGFSISGLTLPLTLGPGQSKTFNVTFAPQSPGGVNGNIAIVNDGSNPTLNIPLSGTGVAAGFLTANPTNLNFGNVQVGNNQSKQDTITNTGGVGVTITQATVTGAGFSISGLTLPLTLGPGQSKTFNVTFAPQSPGGVNGNIAIVNDGSNPTLNIPLSGTGVAAGFLTANPTNLNFGNVQVGKNQTNPDTLTNTGGVDVTITQATVTGAGFSISGLTLPLTLGPGQSKTFNVTFAPQTPGTVNGNIAIVNDGSNPTLNIPLSGTGVAAGFLTANPTNLNFGNVQVGNNQSKQDTLTNTGGVSVTVTEATVTGAGFSISGLTLPLTLGPGQSKTFNVTFAPQTPGGVNGNIAIVNDGSNPTLNIPLSGTGVAAPGVLSANPPSIDFGTVGVGNNSMQSETLTNTGGTTLTVTQATVTGSAFSISGLNLPLDLTPGQSFTFGVTFAPTSGGNFSGNIALVSTASNPNLNIPLTGIGQVAGQLSVTPPSLDFGHVTVGSSKPLNASLNATGASVTVTSASLSSSEFTLSGLTFPFTVPAGQSKQFTVTFTPQMSGAASATLSFVSDASNSPTVESLTGIGDAAQQHSVDLNWNPSQSSGVVGYRVYRGGNHGGPYSQINSGLDANTNYTDGNVQSGQTYYYVTTAVDDTGQESTYSNEASAVIPNP